MENNYWRIIDANYNRAKEGLRTVEDFLRFIYDNSKYTSELKSIRHQLKNALGDLPTVKKMFGARDSLTDVGQSVDRHEMERAQVSDLILAAFGRAKEAMRVLEETLKLVEPEKVETIKAARYKIYNCEKEIILNIIK